MAAVDGTDDCEGDTAIADAAAHEVESDIGVEGQG
jgi:hypothetical protein